MLCSMIFFHGNLMEFLTSCLWKFCLIYGILAFSNGNLKFESGSHAKWENTRFGLSVVRLPYVVVGFVHFKIFN